jgi:hypothetical protein
MLVVSLYFAHAEQMFIKTGSPHPSTMNTTGNTKTQKENAKPTSTL